MTTIVTRAGKGSPLTNNEVDANFTNLNTAKIEVSGTPVDGQVISWDSSTSSWIPTTNGNGSVSSVNVSGASTGITFSGGPITTSGTITMGGTLVVANGGTGATTAAGARTNLGAAASGANSDITSMSGLTGAISSPTYIQFGNGSGTTLAAGRMWYDQTTGSMNVGMGGGNITQQIGEELFLYGKASAAITDSPLQIVYQTGTVGASGVVQFGPTVSGITNGDLIVGVATEPLAINTFGRVTVFGVVHGVTTNGTAYGETWVDGDTIWYNPVTGNPTNVKPVAPNLKVSVGVVINAAGGGAGSFQVEINHGSVLGGTDSNVQLTSPADGQLLQYYGAGGYWRNLAATSVAVTTFSGGTTGLTPSSATSGAITLAGTLNVANGGTGLTSQTANYVYKGNGTSALVQSQIYDNGTNVGIGTASPGAYKLNINGDAYASTLTVGTDLDLIYQSAANKLGFRVGTSTNQSYFNIIGSSGSPMLDGPGGVLAFSTAATERMRIDSSGNVGIGTASPGAYKLNINGDAYASTLTVGTDLDLIYQSAANKLGFRVGTSTNQSYFNIIGSSGSPMLDGPGGVLAFSTAATERMRIDSSGNVGIGTTTPDVIRLRTKGVNAAATDYAFYAENSAGSDLLYARNDGAIGTGTAANSPYNLTTASAANVFVTSAGLLQRSTSSARYKTDIQDATHGLSDVLALRPVTYKGMNDGDTVFGGLIAEEVDAAGLTEFVAYDEQGRPDAIHYGPMVSVLITAIQELTARVAQLEGK